MTRLLVVGGLALAGALLLLVPLRTETATWSGIARAPQLDLSAYSAEPPGESLDLVFLHHSVGARMLASQGRERGDPRLPTEHPDGGGLRRLLEDAGYRVHSTTYGSALGEHTDLFDWLPKFRNQMDDVLAVANQDTRLEAGRRNRIVLFKSCFPNSNFVGAGALQGSEVGPDLTVANARATLTALLAEFSKYPDVLFVYLTAPPQAPGPRTQPAWKWLAKKVLGRQPRAEALRHSGDLAREFNNWVRDPKGWLSGYGRRNVVAFDMFDTLTGHGQSNLLRYATWDGADSHPSAEGSARVAAELVPLLNRAVRYSAISK